MTLEDCFAQFARTAFRLEALPEYDAGATTRYAAWLRRDVLPDRSVGTSAWLGRMAVTTVQGKVWERVRIVGSPLSEYERYEVTVAYVESGAAGERIWIAQRAALPELATIGGDFWLFDSGTSQARAALMRYDQVGQFITADITSDPAVIRECEMTRELALNAARPLNAYLAPIRSGEVAA